MNETTRILPFRQPSAVDDPLTEVLRNGARELLARAVEIELRTFLETTAELKLPDGRARVVRHGYGPARKIATGIGAVEVAHSFNLLLTNHGRAERRSPGSGGPIAERIVDLRDISIVSTCLRSQRRQPH